MVKSHIGLMSFLYYVVLGIGMEVAVLKETTDYGCFKKKNKKQILKIV